MSPESIVRTERPKSFCMAKLEQAWRFGPFRGWEKPWEGSVRKEKHGESDSQNDLKDDNLRGAGTTLEVTRSATS